MSTFDTKPLVDALLSVVSTVDGAVPLHEPLFSGSEWAYVKSCLDDGWVSSVGPFVDRFERDLAMRHGVKHAVATVNGTAALHVILTALGIGPGDEVLTPTLTFVATANAISYTGATPHFVDSDTDRLGVDTAKLAEHMADIGEKTRDGVWINKNTGRVLRAIAPMHVFGHPVDMDALDAIADEYGLIVVEDAAESLGSFYKGKPAGALGRVAALSFNGNKIITAGGGGAVLTDDDDLARRVRHLATTAKHPHPWVYEHDMIGFNYRMPNINAALGCAQLEGLDAVLATKRHLADSYAHALESVAGVAFINEPADSKSNYWLNAVRLNDVNTLRERDAVLQTLHHHGLLCRPVWNLMHSLTMFAQCPRMDLGQAEELEKKIINVPSSTKLGAA